MITECDRSIDVVGSKGFKAYAMGNDKGNRLGEIEAMALELSIILTSQWSFVVEYVKLKDRLDLRRLPYDGKSGERPNTLKEQRQAETKLNFDPTLTG